MDLITTPMSFVEAVKNLLGKKVMPTDLSSADLRALPASIRRQSFFSARNAIAENLQVIKDAVKSVLNPTQEERPDRVTPENPRGLTTVGLNQATARRKIIDDLKAHGYAPDPEIEGTIKDLSSPLRVNLVVKTNVQLAQGAGQFMQGNASQDAVESMPAWELVRFEDREVPRGFKQENKILVPDPYNAWETRFKFAAEAAEDDAALDVLEKTGRMIALKSSALWQFLADGAGGYADTLNNPFPPFAFNSGMGWLAVSMKECIELGLLKRGQPVKPADFDLSELFKEAA